MPTEEFGNQSESPLIITKYVFEEEHQESDKMKIFGKRAHKQIFGNISNEAFKPVQPGLEEKKQVQT